MKVYIAGKVSGLTPEEYHNKFEKCRSFVKRFLKEDIEILIPMDFCDDNWGWDKCMEVCVPMLKSCDLVLMMSDWIDSRGAKEERRIAFENNIPIWYL